ncbi:50S ribosomal protein L33 1 [compost metagenome]
MAKKGNRVQVILECTEHKESGMPGMSRYISTKNRKNTTERLELKKFNPVLRKVTVHKELKNSVILTFSDSIIKIIRTWQRK